MDVTREYYDLLDQEFLKYENRIRISSLFIEVLF